MYSEHFQDLNITSKISKEVHFLGKYKHFPSADHLHNHYLRKRFRLLLHIFATIFFIETFSVTVTKRKLLLWQQILQNCEEKYNLQKLFSKSARRCPTKYILYKIKPNRIGQKSHFSLKSFYFWVEVFCQCIRVSPCTTCLPRISNSLQIRSGFPTVCH